MNKPFDSGPACLSSHPLGGLDVNGAKSFLSSLDVKAYRIYDAISAGKRVCDRPLVLNVGLDGLKLRIVRAEQPISLIRMPRRDPNKKSAGAQMPDDAPA